MILNFYKYFYSYLDTRYPVVKYVGKKIMKWKLSYEPEGFDWDLLWTDNAV